MKTWSKATRNGDVPTAARPRLASTVISEGGTDRGWTSVGICECSIVEAPPLRPRDHALRICPGSCERATDVVPPPVPCRSVCYSRKRGCGAPWDAFGRVQWRHRWWSAPSQVSSITREWPIPRRPAIPRIAVLTCGSAEATREKCPQYSPRYRLVERLWRWCLPLQSLQRRSCRS